MIITIDGPAAAGKSSAARALAQRLGFEYLDTGAMFRAVTLACQRASIDASNEAALGLVLETLHLDMPPGRVLVNGEDVTRLIRTHEVTAAAGKLATVPLVRRHLARLQRVLAEGRNIICEGRDQGTVVFPDAACKFFLVADPIERARRRQHEMAERGESVPWEDILRAQQERDRRDASRDVAPMVPAADAIAIDSTGLSAEQVVDRMVAEVQLRRPPR